MRLQSLYDERPSNNGANELLTASVADDHLLRAIPGLLLS